MGSHHHRLSIPLAVTTLGCHTTSYRFVLLARSVVYRLLLQQRLGSPSPNTEDLRKNGLPGDPSASPSSLSPLRFIFLFFSLSFTWSSTVFVTCFAFSFLLQPNRLRHMNQRRLMLCSRNFCFQTSSHQSSTSSSSSLSSLCFDLCTASSSAVSSFHNSSSLSLSLHKRYKRNGKQC